MVADFDKFVDLKRPVGENRHRAEEVRYRILSGQGNCNTADSGA